MFQNKVQPLILKIGREGEEQQNFSNEVKARGDSSNRNGYQAEIERNQAQQVGSKRLIERQASHKSYESFKNSIRGQTLSNTNILHPKLNSQKSRLPYANQRLVSQESNLGKGNAMVGPSTMFLTQADKHTQEAQTSRIFQLKKKIEKVLKGKTREEILAKGVRHFRDAQLLRPPRNIFDRANNKFGATFLRFYELRQSPIWKFLQTVLSYLFLIQTFLEPQTLTDSFVDEQTKQYVYIQEIIILLFSLADNIFGLLLFKTSNKNKFINFLSILYRFILVIAFFADFLVFWHIQALGIRFASMLRPFWLIQFQEDIYKALKSIILSFKQVIDIFLFFIAMSAFFGYMGYNLFSEYTTKLSETDKYFVFGSVGTSMIGMYTLISMDTYPSILKSIVLDNAYYLIFFLPYIAINLFFLLFIPVAVIFENYKLQRAKIMLQDEVIVHEALTFSFFCISNENDQDYITREQFFNLMNAYFKGKGLRDKINEMYSILNIDEQEKMSLNEFKDSLDLMMSSERMFDNSNIYWDSFRAFCNKYLHFEQIGLSPQWNYFILFLVTVNTTLIFIYTFLPQSTDNETTAFDEWMTNIDMVFNSIYIFDVCLKMIAFGIEGYFKNSWNNFDFFMVCVSIITIFGLNYIYFLKKAKSTKLLKLTKIQKVLKIFRSIRSLKLFKILKLGADALIRVQKLFHKVALCVPSLYGLLKTYFLFSFSYGIVGTYLFNTQYNSYKSNSPYQDNDFTDFNSLQGALFALFQVITQSRWVDYVFGYGYQFNITVSTLYFCFYHMFSILFFMSLLQGIVWEVFGVVEEYFRQHEIEELHHLAAFQSAQQDEEKCNNLDFQNSGQQMGENADLVVEEQTQGVKGFFRTRGGIKQGAQEEYKREGTIPKEMPTNVTEQMTNTETELLMEDLNKKLRKQKYSSNIKLRKGEDENDESKNNLIKSKNNQTINDDHSIHSHNGAKQDEEQFEIEPTILTNGISFMKNVKKHLSIVKEEDLNLQQIALDSNFLRMQQKLIGVNSDDLTQIPHNDKQHNAALHAGSEESDTTSQVESTHFKIMSPLNSFLIRNSNSSDHLLQTEVFRQRVSSFQSKKRNSNPRTPIQQQNYLKVQNYSMTEATDSVNINSPSSNQKKIEELADSLNPPNDNLSNCDQNQQIDKESQTHKSSEILGMRIETEEANRADNLFDLEDLSAQAHQMFSKLENEETKSITPMNNSNIIQQNQENVIKIIKIKSPGLSQSKKVIPKIDGLDKKEPLLTSKEEQPRKIPNSPSSTSLPMPAAIKKVIGILKKQEILEGGRENRFGGGKQLVNQQLSQLDKYFQKRMKIVRYQIDLMKQLSQLENFLQLHDQTGLMQAEMRQERILTKHKQLNFFTISKQHALQKMTYLKDNPQNIIYGNKQQYLQTTEQRLGYQQIPLNQRFESPKQMMMSSHNSAGSGDTPNGNNDSVKIDKEKGENQSGVGSLSILDEVNVSSFSGENNQQVSRDNLGQGEAQLNDSTFLRLNNIFSFLLHLLTNVQQLDSQVLIQKLFVVEQSINQVIFGNYDETQPLNHFKFVFGQPSQDKYFVLIKQYDMYDSQKLFGDRYAQHHKNLLQQQQTTNSQSNSSIIEVKTITADGSPWSAFTKSFKLEKTIYFIQSLFEIYSNTDDLEIAKSLSTSMQYMRGCEFCLDDLTQGETELYASFILSKSLDNLFKPVTSASQLPFISFICNRSTGEPVQNKKIKYHSVNNQSPKNNIPIIASGFSKHRNTSEQPSNKQKKKDTVEEKGGYSIISEKLIANSKQEDTQKDKEEDNQESINPLEKLKRTKSPFRLTGAVQKQSTLINPKQEKVKIDATLEVNKKGIPSLISISDRQVSLNKMTLSNKMTQNFTNIINNRRKKNTLQQEQEHIIKIYNQIQQFFSTHSHLISGVIERLSTNITAHIPCYIESNLVDEANLKAS